MNSWIRTAASSMLCGIMFAAAMSPANTLQKPARPTNSTTESTADPELGRVSKRRINPKDGAVMIYIPAGAFPMGDDNQRWNPRHTVTLTGFWIYKDFVTVGMYRKYCQENGKQMPPEPSFDPDWSKVDHPIVNVSWNDAAAYCTWAQAALPTEAQWEKAASGTGGLEYPWGNTFNSSKVVASKAAIGDAGGTNRVGEFGVSPYGCTDMAGNVDQWCADWYFSSFWYGVQAGTVDPVNQRIGDKTARVTRGGSWRLFYTDLFLASYRYGYNPGFVYPYVGFRCATAR